MKAYKLTDKDDRTYAGCQWGKGVTHRAGGKGELCTSGWIHYYGDPMLALFLDPHHGNFGSKAHLWEVEVSGKIETDHGLKFGATELTTVKRLRKRRITKEHRVRFAIFCAKKVCHDKAWNKWADAWLDGTDRTHSAAAEANAPYAAAYAAAAAAAYAHDDAAAAAAYAAAAAAAYAHDDAYAYADAANAADIDLVPIARRAIGEGGGYEWKK